MCQSYRLRTRQLDLFAEESQQLQKKLALLQNRLLVAGQDEQCGEQNVTQIAQEAEKMAGQLAQIKLRLARRQRCL